MMERIADDTERLKELAFLEGKLRQLRGLPHLEIDCARSGRQRITPAAKMYRETLQQYNSLMKTLLTAMGRNTPEEELPFRSFLKQYDVRD